MKKFLFLILLFISFNISAFSHSGKPKYHVVIDTDGAIDDMRAISMLLAGNDIRVLAITCSQGTLMPNTIYEKVLSLLACFHHEGIRVAVSEKTKFELPPWSGFARNISWGKESELLNKKNAINSTKLLDKVSKNYKNKITLIALGSLQTYADWIKSNPQNASKIERIIWYNNSDLVNGFNYKASPESFEFLKSSSISLEIVSANKEKLTLNQAYLNELHNCNSVYAKQIVKTHNQTIVQKKISQNHLKLWDDLVPLYLTIPLIFDVKEKDSLKYISLNKALPDSFIFESINELLISSTQTNNRVFVSFPIDKSLYKQEYSKIIDSTIQAFGLTEWKAIAMTNEIHGHTGIYSIIGAKMGIRAMEYFNVGVNNVFITSFAGKKPPLSCFNDGLQISTGATIGQGLINISDSISNIPSAIFEFNNQKIHISVKEKIAKQMRKEIKFGIQNYGLLTAKYWQYIEELAIKYWSGFNRSKIFEIKEIN